MKKITFIASMLLAMGGVNAQNPGTQQQGYIPFHSLLEQYPVQQPNQNSSISHATNSNSSSAARSTAYPTAGLHTGELAFRHDSWDFSQGGWAFVDSGKYVFDNAYNETAASMFKFSGTNSAWDGFTNEIYTYDNVGRILSDTKQNWINGSWVNLSRYTNTYNTDGSMAATTWEAWSNNTWIKTYQYSYQYDGLKNLAIQIDMVWDNINNTWVNAEKFSHIYNDNHYMVREIGQKWSGGTWVNNYQKVYTYDSYGNNLMQTEQTWINNAWVYYFQSQYGYDYNNNDTCEIGKFYNTATSSWDYRYKYCRSYDENRNLTFFAQDNWDANNQAWVPVFSNTYAYDATGNILSSMNMIWNSNTNVLENGSRTEYTYNESGKITDYKDYYWNGGSAAWVPNTYYSYTYDLEGNNVYELYQKYSTYTNAYVNADQYIYYYNNSTLATALREPGNEFEAGIFPNPSNGMNMQLHVNMPGDAEINLNTYDEGGKLIRTETKAAIAGVSNIELNYSGLTSGVYFIQLLDRNSGETATVKFMKQ